MTFSDHASEFRKEALDAIYTSTPYQEEIGLFRQARIVMLHPRSDGASF